MHSLLTLLPLSLAWSLQYWNFSSIKFLSLHMQPQEATPLVGRGESCSQTLSSASRPLSVTTLRATHPPFSNFSFYHPIVEFLNAQETAVDHFLFLFSVMCPYQSLGTCVKQGVRSDDIHRGSTSLMLPRAGLVASECDSKGWSPLALLTHSHCH